MEWWSNEVVYGGGRNERNFYDFFGIEGVREGSCELNGRYYDVMQLTY